MSKSLKNVLASVLLVAFFGGFVWLVNSAYGGEMARTKQALDSADPAQATVGPLTVHHSACRYLFPNAAGGALGRLIWPGCAREAAAIRERFTPVLQEAQCGARGSNTIVFQRR